MSPDHLKLNDGPTVERAAWESRAVEAGDSSSGVLVRGFGTQLNHALHERHARTVAEVFAPSLPPSPQVLDVGCGYGRLAEVLKVARPDSEVVGVDYSLTYCRFFRERLASGSVCADLRRMPVARASLHGLMAVTVLMYLGPRERLVAVGDLVQLLMPGGVALFVDPSAEYIDLARRLVSSSSPTGGRGLCLGEYERLAQGAGVSVVSVGGYPGFSVLLPLLFVMRRRSRPLGLLLGLAGRIDRRIQNGGRLSFHRWMLVRRPLDDAPWGAPPVGGR